MAKYICRDWHVGPVTPVSRQCVTCGEFLSAEDDMRYRRMNVTYWTLMLQVTGKIALDAVDEAIKRTGAELKRRGGEAA